MTVLHRQHWAPPGVTIAAIAYGVGTLLYGLWLRRLNRRTPDVTDGRALLLDRVRDASGVLRDVANLIEEDRVRISEAQLTLRKLQSEEQKLKPIVESRREAIDAILAAHAARAAGAVWRERLVGFGIGVMSSLLAGILLYLLLTHPK